MAIVPEAQLAIWRSQDARLPYSDSDWAAIIALLARYFKPPTTEVEARFRHDIECSAYLIKSKNSEPKNKTQWIAAWQDVAKASMALRDVLAVVTEEEIQEGFDAWCSARINEANENIRSIGATEWPRRKFNKPAVAQLVGQFLDLWSHCGGALTITIATGGENEGRPKGDLIEFLKTATNPIFQTSPLSNNTLSHLINKKRAEEEILANRPKIRGDEF